MLAFRKYVRDLEALARADSLSPGAASVLAALNGQPAIELRRAVSLAKRREAGAFFTPPHVVATVRSRLRGTLSHTSVILDPACGAGDLLLAAALELPPESSLDARIRSWGRRLQGLDLHSEFIDAARARILILARSLSSDSPSPADSPASLLNGLRVGSGLEEGHYPAATHIVMNPPFGQVPAPLDLPWATGMINRAALFIWTAITGMRPSARLVAVIPDVLRSGTRYRRFRSAIRACGDLSFPVVHDRFDEATDVHTALLDFVRRSQPAVGLSSEVASQRAIVGDLFAVNPGNCPRWGTLDSVSETRAFSGTTFAAPFVVVRRTSRPEDRYRAVPTLIVNGPQTFAIENHLLVAIPRDKSLSRCKQLVALLRRPASSLWLNETIRCRHLTVAAVAGIPWE
ncbi:MAG: hypothetical protein N838_22800 [Thiohalocapsa sp. PB-PSB1]|nr:MAG: hypothetical protein N838_22800 [Thiohalocapsa sp. PB-PSB1]